MTLTNPLVPVPADHVVAALGRAAAVNPLFGFATDPAGTRPATDFDAAVADLIWQIGQRFGTDERRVAASLVLLGYSARLIGPPLAVLLTDGLLVDVAAPRIRFAWRTDKGFCLVLTERVGVTGAASALHTRWRHDVLLAHLGSVINVICSTVRVAPGLLWGNVASGLVGALAALARSGVVPTDRCADFATATLAGADAAPLRGTGSLLRDGDRLGFRRRSCCLFYRLPGGGFCGDCCLPAGARA